MRLNSVRWRLSTPRSSGSPEVLDSATAYIRYEAHTACTRTNVHSNMDAAVETGIYTDDQRDRIIKVTISMRREPHI